MQLPNKLFSCKESIISKFPIILRMLNEKPRSVNNLYRDVYPAILGTEEFLEILDCLYALNKIDFDDKNGVVIYVS